MTSSGNPYVGPRTFSEKDGQYFFGREQEARDLTARIISERLLLFYAQSGAGKSSLVNTRVIPRLRDEEGFIVLPVGRVSGELPLGVTAVENIFTFNLMNSLDQSSDVSARLSGLCLKDFLARLAGETTIDERGKRRTSWVYKPDIQIEEDGEKRPRSGPRFALVIDQFEEIITSHPDHWQEREEFFRQLNEALLDDPNLWVVLTLREDFVAALDPYAPLVLNRLRARFYMERMEEKGALAAVQQPAELGGRPFAPGVAEQLVNDLRQVRVPGREETVPSQYVEPVQLQVVCYQMWENLEASGGGAQITAADLEESGDVDQALTEFYEETLLAVLADPSAMEIDERELRSWFERELITAAGTRGLVDMGKSNTRGLPNAIVRLLQARFLVRTELRAGATWVELVHDRFVKPIHDSNSAWFDDNLSVLQRQALLWEGEERPPDLLLRGDALHAAEVWAEENESTLEDYEKEFLKASKLAGQEEEKREQRRTRLIAALAALAMIIAMGFLIYSIFTTARTNILRAEVAAATADYAKEAAARAEAQALESASQAEVNRLLAEKAEQEAENARTQQAVAETARAEAEFALATAEAARLAAVAAQNEAVDARIRAVGTAEAAALATSAANLQIALTGQAPVAAEETILVEANEPGATDADAQTADDFFPTDQDLLDRDLSGLGTIILDNLPVLILPETGGGDSVAGPESPTPQAGATPTLGATPAFTPTPAAAATATPNSAQVLAAQLASIQATQTRLAGGMAGPESTPEAQVVANWIPMTVYAQANEDSAPVAVVGPWETARILGSERQRWLSVETAGGETGWVDGRWRVFTGDAGALPAALSFRMISDRDDLDFIFGEVVETTAGDDYYRLRFEPSFEAEPIIEIPAGTETLTLLDNQGSDAAWMLVTLADIGGDGLIRTGYLPRSVVEETGSFFNKQEERLISETGVVACALAAGDAVMATANARLWSDPDVLNGDFLPILDIGEELVVVAEEPVWGPIRRDIDDYGWWWQVETETGTTGWIWQNRLEECNQ